VRRRGFIKLFGATVAWPLAARAQPAALPLVGFLNGAEAATNRHIELAFRDGLAELGYSEGRTVAIEFHWAAGRYDTLPAIAADLARRHVAVIVVGGGGSLPVIKAQATGMTPIVFNTGADPVRTGLVKSLNRPGGHVTGVNIFTTGLEPKRLQFLRDLVPGASSVAVLFNPTFPTGINAMADVHAAAGALAFQIRPLPASARAEIDAAFASLARERASALLVTADPFFNGQRDHIVALTQRVAIPAIFEWREFVAAGGLASYGTNLREAYGQIGRYAGRILKGENPGDLPVVQSTKFELVINLKTAKALGLNLSQNLISAADEVIE
jgi:putative ABC transport system substrate-binding protein